MLGGLGCTAGPDGRLFGVPLALSSLEDRRQDLGAPSFPGRTGRFCLVVDLILKRAPCCSLQERTRPDHRSDAAALPGHARVARPGRLPGDGKPAVDGGFAAAADASGSGR